MMEVKEVIVVEGTSDKNHLLTFIKADILTCNGSAIDGFSLSYLEELSKTRGVILLTDPDYPGTRIRNEISLKVPLCKHAFIDKKKAVKRNKVGVAECEKEEIIKALKHLLTPRTDVLKKNLLIDSDLFSLNLMGENSQKNKEKICAFFHLGHCNSKTLLKRLNLLGISKKQLMEALYD